MKNINLNNNSEKFENDMVIEHNLYEVQDANRTQLKNYETKALTLKKEGGEDVFLPNESVQYSTDNLTSIQSLFTKIFVNNLGANVILETGNFEALWREEMKLINSTKTNSINKITIKMHEIVAAPIISRRLINVSQFDVREYVRKNIERSILTTMDYATILGDGNNQPSGILNNEISFKDIYEPNKIKAVKINKETLVEDLLKMENQLPLMYRDGASWIISRSLFNHIQMYLLKVPNGINALMRDGITYRLFGRKVMIFDGLDNNEKEIHGILIHPCAYTVLENPHMDIIENNQDIDVKLIFIKNFGGAVTNHQALIVGELESI
jgi:HK97 family phage major capsid protein